MTDRRDFKGWRGLSPPKWPNGARLAVSFVVNVEEGAELSLADGDERNESTYEIKEEVVGAADLCMESHFAYGTKQGYRRIVEAFDAHDVRANFSTCGRVAQRSPWLMQDVVARGHEVSCHGWRWERLAGMDERTERVTIARSRKAIAEAAGVAPVGWHTRSSSTLSTRRLLVEHGGFLYDSDAYDDDIPRIEEIAGRPHVVLPYAFDTNDMRFQPGAGFVHAEDFARYTIAAFDRLYAEGANETRMFSVGLHLRIIGRPARIGGLEALLAHVGAHDGVWLASRAEIAHAWREAMGLEPWLANEDANR